MLGTRNTRRIGKLEGVCSIEETIISQSACLTPVLPLLLISVDSEPVSSSCMFLPYLIYETV